MSRRVLKWERIDSQINIKGEWKGLDKRGVMVIRRTKVPGGWLVRGDEAYDEVNPHENSYGLGYGLGGLTFVPDPNHNWDGSSL